MYPVSIYQYTTGVARTEMTLQRDQWLVGEEPHRNISNTEDTEI